MSHLTFDGQNKLIIVNTGVIAIDSGAQLYSEWKAWVHAGNAGYLPAFRVVGGDPIGGGINAGSYFFLQNQYGWRIRPDTNLNVTGNLYSEDIAQPTFVPSLGVGTYTVTMSKSSLTQVVSVGSGLSVTEQVQLKSIYDITGGGGQQIGTQLICYASDNVTVVATFDLYDKNGVLTSDMSKVVKQLRV